MIERTEILKYITLRICTEKIAFYYILIEQENIRPQQNQ